MKCNSVLKDFMAVSLFSGIYYIAISQNFFHSLLRPLQLRGSLQIISHSATFREINTSFQDPVLDCCMPFGVVMFGQVCYLECKSRFLLKSYDRY